MSYHQFKIGQPISFKLVQRGTRSAAPGQYTVTGYRPDEDGEPCYRIKSTLEQYERIVREGDLRASSPFESSIPARARS